MKLADLRQLPRQYWGVLAIAILFTLARFSEAFLILRASAEGLPLALAPLVLVAMNVVYALGAYPAGVLSDFVQPRILLLWGLALLIAADLVFALLPGLAWAFAGILLWGGHMALAQGLLAKLVADLAPARIRGSAFGMFHLASGVAMLIASLAAGLLWDLLGPRATFIAGAGFAFAAFLLLALRIGARPAR